MTSHLLLITLGPVQEFIAQARRTRDLWYGSHLLSELGRAAARALIDCGARLVLPSMEAGDPELEVCLAPLRANRQPPLSIANKILAEVPPGLSPEQLARSARAAVIAFWRDEVAAPVKQRCAGLLAADIDEAWAEQIKSFLEFYATWAPLDDYAETRRALEQTLAARKNLREFAPWTRQRGNVPKSSLDGARETVLGRPRQRDAKLATRFRIADAEQLDAVGLVKRAGGNPGQFVPIVNVALAPWVALGAREVADELDALRAACREAGLAQVTRALPCCQDFPFDASVLLPSRWTALFEEQNLRGDPETWGRDHVRPLLRQVGEPYPYVACLVADGDRMGALLDGLGSADAHRELSRQLAAFSVRAREIVEKEHMGVLVYAGGDDVLAFVPVSQALACAEALRHAFLEDRPQGNRPTLSVGLGIGHVMESMGDLLELGRAAEREAKHDRNSLGLVVDKRSGGRFAWRSSWDADPVSRLEGDSRLLGEALSSRKVYEIARTFRSLPTPAVSLSPGWSRVLCSELRRSLARSGDGQLSPEAVGLQLDPKQDYATSHEAVDAWIKRLLAARLFAMAQPWMRTHREEVPQ